MKRDELELLLRAKAREFLRLEDGDYWDSGISSYQAAALWPLLEPVFEKAWMYDDLCD